MPRRSTCASRSRSSGADQGRRRARRSSPSSPTQIAELPRFELRGLMCMPPAQPDGRSRARAVRPAAQAPRGAERAGPQARYTVDGDERRLSSRRSRKARRTCGSARRYSAADKARRERTMNNIRRLAFIGGGNMAAALIGGLTRHGLAERSRSWSPIRAPNSSTRLVRDLRHHGSAPDNASAATGAEVVILAVKPQQMRAVALALAAPPRSLQAAADLSRRGHPACGAGALVRSPASRSCAPCRIGRR